MTRMHGVLLGLLVVSNAAWLVHTLGEEPAPPATGIDGGADDRVATELAALTERIGRLETQLAEARSAEAGPAAVRGAEPAGTAGRRDDGPTLGTAGAAAEKPTRKVRYFESSKPSPSTRPAATADAKQHVAGWTRDVLQIEDPSRREAGLVAIGRAIADRDSALAAAALRALYGLRDATYDKHRFREAVRARLDDADGGVRAAAAYALLQVEPDASDVDRVLDAAEANPGDTSQLIVAAWLSERRVEGRLADLYVKALGAADERTGKDISNQLRGMWVTEEVEDAVLAVFAKRTSDRLWWHILGQIKPTRAARVRVFFEVLAEDRNDPPQLLGRALQAGNLEPEAGALAADLAAAALPKAPNVLTRRLMLQILREQGTAEHAAALQAYADNEMVAEALRREAAAVAAVAAGRR